MKVCIAEKPSVAKEIASILGATSRKDGYFEGNGYQVTWTFGHLCTLKEPQDYLDTLKFWNLNTLPIVPLKFGIKLIQNKGVKEQFDTIKKLVTNCDEVINCGDAGQEGELIQRWVLQHAGCKSPITRLWISSLTEEAIRKGFNNLLPSEQFDSLYWAGSSRAIGDWLLGINATRLYTLKYAPKGMVLSIGRVQTPTLAILVARQKEIEAFVSNKFWELKTVFKGVKFYSENGKISTIEEANSLLESIKDSLFTILSFEQKEATEGVPKLYDLTSLQVECNKKLGLGADETLKIAQTLYERKHITYPRVDTRYLPTDIYPTIEGVLKSLTQYSELVQPLLGKPIRNSKSVFNNTKITDHHAIIPTNINANNLGKPEAEVYDIIAKRFIANFYPDALLSKTSVVGEANKINFKANGKQILDPGWQVVYGKDKSNDDGEDSPNDDEGDQLLPEFKEGENGPHEPLLEEKQTSSPKPYTEATLLRAMETAGKQVDDDEVRELMKENGIGRPSTRANIIQTLYKRQYIRKTRKNITATITGIQLIDTIQNELLKSAELTGKWEKNLRDIESGTYDVRLFMQEMKSMVVDLVREVKYSKDTALIEVESKTKKPQAKTSSTADAICPKCKKGTVIKGKSAFGCSRYKEGCDILIPFVFEGTTLSPKQLSDLIIKGKTGTIKNIKDGKSGHLSIDKEHKIVFSQKEKVALICPKCKTGNMIKGKTAYGCSRFKEDCQFILPFQIGSFTLPDKSLQQLITKSKTTLIKDIKTTKGTLINGRFVLSKEYKIEFNKAN